MADLPFTLDQLRILRAIVSEGSFKKAADSLYVTQPAVSLQIQNLEKQLEVSLFDRGGRKAQLTEAGHLLLSYCDRILSQCHEACRALDDLHNLKGGSLIVGASQTTGTYLMPRMIGLFRQKFPDVAVQLQVHSTRRTGWSVANGQIDLAIIGGELPPELKELLQVVPYASDELALVLPVKHPLARLPELTKEDLYRLGFVCLDAQSTTRKMVDQLLARSVLMCSVYGSRWSSIPWRRSRMPFRRAWVRLSFRWFRSSGNWRPAPSTGQLWWIFRCVVS